MIYLYLSHCFGHAALRYSPKCLHFSFFNEKLTFCAFLQPQEVDTLAAPMPATKDIPLEVQEEEMTIHIAREPGQGLGISIAGGKGSTPVKGDDEVSTLVFSDVPYSV